MPASPSGRFSRLISKSAVMSTVLMALAGCVAQDPYLLGTRLADNANLPFTEADTVATRRAERSVVDLSMDGIATFSGAPLGSTAADTPPVQPQIQAPPQFEVPALAAPPAALGVRGGGTFARIQVANGIAPLPDALMGDLVREYGSRPDFLSRAMQRSSPYLRHIVEELERNGMPAELALLPVIESGYEVRALSPAAASGIWQFIPETGRRYGLTQGWLRDERRDPMAATAAAISYLGDLYRRFGNWHLALAGYNCGEACVGRAIDRARAAGRTPDFPGIYQWLPAETQSYVPRFVAVRTVFRNPAAYGVVLPPVDRAARIVRHRLDRDADLASLARLSGTTVEELTVLNAGVLRQVVAGDARFLWLAEQHSVRLQTSIRALPSDQASALMQFKPAQAKPQEKLAGFAARHNIDVARLRGINGIPASLSTIRSGTLFVPLDIGESPSLLAASALAPLRMQGEEELMVQRASVVNRDEQLLASHPHWVESGWIPGRLQLRGRARPAR